MSKPKIYLCGKMEGLTFEQMNTWRAKAKDLLNNEFECINPVDYADVENNKEFDLWLLKKCNLVLVNLANPDTIGTAIELDRAKQWGIPVIAFGRTDKTVHPWMAECISKEADIMEYAINYIFDYYYPNL